MLKFNHTKTEELTLQKIGNKLKEIPNIKAQELLGLEQEEEEQLKPFFLSSFKGQLDLLRFHHHIELSYNPVYQSAVNYFNGELDFLELSHKVLGHLYEKSNHPHIKSGELMMVHFTDIIFKDIHTEGIGIFKIENKVPFIQFKEADQEIFMRLNKGVKLNKIDKSALILNTEKDDGLRLFSVDHNNYDAAYWQKAFLTTEYVKTDDWDTKNFVQFMNTFSQNIHQEEDPFHKKKLLSEGIQILQENEIVNETLIQEEWLKPNDISIEDYHDFKKDFEQAYEQPIASSFSVSPSVFKKEEKKLKRDIVLDESIQIKLNLNDADALQENVEKGFDEAKQMHYYKIYFDQER